MTNYQNILVVLDPNTAEQKALKRALEISAITKAKLTLFLSIFDFSYEMTTMLASEERESMRESVIKNRQQWLSEIADKYQIDQSSMESVVIWHHRPFEAILNQVTHNQHDLVIKATHEHHKLKAVLFTPTDWHILRKCPCPVLLVKEHSWPKHGNIIAAVNIGSDEEEHISLNRKITESALRFAKTLSADVHLVNSYPGTPVNISIEVPEFDASFYNETMRKHHEKSMLAHAKQFNIAKKHTHVLEGLPEDVIDQLSQELDAELVVLGTVGRTGFSAALIGNTAEHVIDQLDCDLLALKPDGYVS